MTVRVCKATGLDPELIEPAVWAREEVLSTGIGHGVALPHARVDGLKESLVAVGISDGGIDFDAPDDQLARVIFLILTPAKDPGAQLEIASEIALCFRAHRTLELVLCTNSFTDFLALMNSVDPERV
jgi:mannitol/fructose-specific phosphotransferase system IIA component (Ntr-type)